MNNFARFRKQVKTPPITLKDILENGENWNGVDFHGERAQLKLMAVCNRPFSPTFEGLFKKAEEFGEKTIRDIFNDMIDFHGNDFRLMTVMTLILATRQVDTQYSNPDISRVYGNLYDEAVLLFSKWFAGSELAYFLDKNYIF